MPRPPLAALAELDQYPGRIPLAALSDWLARTELTLEDVRPFLRFSPDHYVRNLMYAGPGYQALVLCWRSGQRSPIHDHTGSSCGVKVISGVATETTFASGAQRHGLCPRLAALAGRLNLRHAGRRHAPDVEPAAGRART